MTSDARLKEQQTKHWDSVAAGWAAWLEWTERNFAPLTEWFRATAWAGAARVLDVACGAGYPACAAAAHLGPYGRVVATDISPNMVGAASQCAHASGIENVEFREMDAEALAFAEGSFDAVTNAYGLMFCPDMNRALKQARRVLRPGGRIAVATWDLPENSPFFHVITTVAAPLLRLQPPAAGAPGPFRLANPDELSGALRAAGYSNVSIQPLSMTFEVASVGEYCRMFGDLAWKNRIQVLSVPERQQLETMVTEAVHPHVRNGRLQLVAASWCASGQR